MSGDPGAAFAAACLAFEGVPFRLHGRDPATGLDCVGLVACALARCGRRVETPEGYALRALSLAPLLGFAARNGFAVLADDSATIAGDAVHARIAAQGIADSTPVLTPIAQARMTARPLSPVHGAVLVGADGRLELRWTRRARGGWLWRDGVDLTLGETAEAYVVVLGPAEAPLAQWTVAEPTLTLSAAEVAALPVGAAGAPFSVRQIGDRAVSPALLLGPLP